MQVRIEDVSPVEKKLIVEVPWDLVNSKLSGAYKELARQVNLKGFRRGKVPRSVLQSMFGKRVRDQVATELVREGFIAATTDHDLQAVSEPKVEQELQIKKGEPFAFEAIVEVKGDVAVKDHFGMELTKRPVNVTDETVEQSVEGLRKEHTELMPIEGRDITSRTDFITASIKGTIGEREVDRPAVPLDLENTAGEPIPGLAAALTGIPIDVTDHAIELQIADDYPDQEIAGQTAKLVISITEARHKNVPELDDEFAKDTGKGETVEELKATIRKELEDRQAEMIQGELRDAALKELVKRNAIPVAASLIDRAVQHQYRRILSMMGGLPAGKQLPLDKELAESMRPAAEDEVRGQLLLDALATEEKIEVTEEEIAERVTEIAKMQGMQPARLRAELDRDGQLEGIRFQLRQDKTLDLLISKATVTEKEPEPEEQLADDKSHDAEGPATASTETENASEDTDKDSNTPEDDS